MSLGRYDRIEKATLTYGKDVYTDQYLLTGRYDDGMSLEDSGLEVDLTGNCAFNCDYAVSERKTMREVKCIQDILDFAAGHNIDLSLRQKNSELIVGGSNDCVIHENLEFEWDES